METIRLVFEIAVMLMILLLGGTVTGWVVWTLIQDVER